VQCKEPLTNDVRLYMYCTVPQHMYHAFVRGILPRFALLVVSRGMLRLAGLGGDHVFVQACTMCLRMHFTSLTYFQVHSLNLELLGFVETASLANGDHSSRVTFSSSSTATSFARTT
jgi:hypothetical protein